MRYAETLKLMRLDRARKLLDEARPDRAEAKKVAAEAAEAKAPTKPWWRMVDKLMKEN